MRFTVAIKSADKQLSELKLMDDNRRMFGAGESGTNAAGRHVDCQGNNRLLGIHCKQVIETVSCNWSPLPEAGLHR